MIILGIDQSLSCTGLVILDDSNDIPNMVYHGVIKTSKKDGSIFERFNIISNRILKLIRVYNIDTINIEGLAFGRIPGNASRDLAGLQGVIISNILEVYNKESIIIAPKAVKKFATGSGNAKKEDMIEAVPEIHRSQFIESGFKKSTGIFDLADAYHIALFQ